MDAGRGLKELVHQSLYPFCRWISGPVVSGSIKLSWDSRERPDQPGSSGQIRSGFGGSLEAGYAEDLPSEGVVKLPGACSLMHGLDVLACSEKWAKKYSHSSSRKSRKRWH